MNPVFEWDETKAQRNLAKHGVAFSTAAQLLKSDSIKLEIFDADHSCEEERLVTLGNIDGQVLLVSWTERDDYIIRIISARKATRKEAFAYYRFANEQ